MTTTKLVIGMQGKFVVKAIQNAATSYAARNTGATKYCHLFQLCDDAGEVYKAQVCTDFEEQNICAVNDIVEIKVKSFSIATYTVDILNVFPAGTKTAAVAPASTSTAVEKPFVPSKNLVVSGKASAIAMQMAINVRANRPLTMSGGGEDEDIKQGFTGKWVPIEDFLFPLADKIYDWLIKKDQ